VIFGKLLKFYLSIFGPTPIDKIGLASGISEGFMGI